MHQLVFAVFAILTVTCQGEEVHSVWSKATAGHWGKWGTKDICPEHRYVNGFRMKSEKNQKFHRDDAGLTGVELFCRGGGSVKSSESHEGDWLSASHCDGADNPVVGFRIKIEKKGGFWSDDTGANRVELLCKSGQELLGEAYTNWGDWSSWHKCPQGMVVVGVQTRVEGNQGAKDDSGMNGMNILCRDQPVDGGWGEWKKWNKCSKNCTSGIQTRNRLCNNPPPKFDGKKCSGMGVESRPCIEKCEVTFSQCTKRISHADCERIAKEKGKEVTDVVNIKRAFPQGCYVKRKKGKEPVFYFNKEPKLKGKCSSTRICFCAEKMEKQDVWSQDEDMEDDFDEEDENQQGDIEGEDFFEELNSLEELL